MPKTLEDIRKKKSIRDLRGTFFRTAPELPKTEPTEISIEPTQADLDIYRRMGLKNYTSPSGRKYPLAQPSQIQSTTSGKKKLANIRRQVSPAPTEPKYKYPGFTPPFGGAYAAPRLKEPEADYLIERFGKQLANAFARVGETVISHPLSPIGLPERETQPYRAQVFKELEASGFRGSAAQAEQLVRTRTAQLAAAKRVPKFQIAPAEGTPEKVTDVAAGLTAFISQLWLTKKILPKGTPDPIIWEIQNQATGGIPGEGAAIRLTLGGIGKIPTGSLTGKVAKVGLESGLFAGYTAAIGGDAEDVIIAGLIPITFNAWHFAKQRHHITNYERNLRSQALQKHQQRVKLGMRRDTSQAYLKADMRIVDSAVAKAKQKIYHDDAFAPAKEKWEVQRQKALKMIASGKPEQVRVGNDILNWMGKRPGLPIKPIEQQIKEIRQTTKGRKVKFPTKKPTELLPTKKTTKEMTAFRKEAAKKVITPPTEAIPAPGEAVEAITPEEAVGVAKPFNAVVYRGISEKTPISTGIAEGIHYTTNKKLAQSFAEDYGKGELIEEELTLKNPFYLTDESRFGFDELEGISHEDRREGESLPSLMTRVLRERGYDGIVYEEGKEIIVFPEAVGVAPEVKVRTVSPEQLQEMREKFKDPALAHKSRGGTIRIGDTDWIFVDNTLSETAQNELIVHEKRHIEIDKLNEEQLKPMRDIVDFLLENPDVDPVLTKLVQTAIKLHGKTQAAKELIADGLFEVDETAQDLADLKAGKSIVSRAVKRRRVTLGREKVKPEAVEVAPKPPSAVKEKITPIIEPKMGVEKPEVAVERPVAKAEEVKPTGAPSKIGFPKGAGEIELPAEAIGKEPVSARQIIESLSKSLKVPYANMATHRRRTAAGFYEARPVGIRQINVRDLDTAAHEAGHHIDYFWKVRRAGISKIGRKTWRMPEGTAKGTAAELTRLGKMLYGEKKPKGGYRSEGIAEFIRGYLTGHLDVKKEAPKFYQWFIKDYLSNNPEVAIGLNNARDMLTDYRLQGAEARIESQISTKEIKAAMVDRIRGGNLWLQTMFIDEFAPLRAILEEKKLRLAGVERLKQPLKPEEDPYELAVYYSQKEGARTRQMVLFGTIDLWGNKTGKGLKEIMKPIADQNAVRPFTHYMFAAEALHRWKQGKNPGISKADAQHVYDLYKDNEGWKETFKEVTDWNHRVLHYLVEAGAIEPELEAKILEQNPIYIPLLRAFVKGEKRFGGSGAGRGLITTKKGIFSMKGSGREIIDPFESMITQTRRMLSIAHKSVIARSLADLEAKHRGLADFIWRVPAPKKATTFRAEQAIRQLQKMGVDVTGADADALMTVYGNSPIYLGKENIIAIVQNGKKSWYEVSPEMYRLLQGLDKFYLPRFLNITLGKAGRAVRLGATGINASFGLVRNPIRDAADTIFKGTHARGPLASVQGVAKDLSRMGLTKSLGINPSKAAEEFVGMGGQISGFVGQDRKSLQHLRGEMLASSVGRYFIHTVSHPIDALREVFGVAESGPRIQEYEKALIVGEKKYGKGSPSAKIYAFNKAQDQTINYSQHGGIGKWLNSMIPFWNANAQDPSKVYRTFRTRGKEATAYAVAFLTLPALGLWWYNKDEEWYKELPAYETANYLHAKVPGKDVILRIPVPFLVGHIFQSTPVAMFNALYRADPKRIKEHFEQVLKGDVYPLAEWPAIVAPLIDVLQNKDWAGRPIVPRGVEGKLPSDQYKEYTTEFCKTIGKIFKQSPAKIEYLINAWSGGLYRRTGRIAGIITKAPEERQLADWPIIGAIIVRDPYAPKRSIERFYDEKEQLNRMYQSKKIEPESDLDRKRKRYNYISTKFLSLYWDKLQKTRAVAERKKIYQKINDLIKKAQKKAE